MTQQPGVLVISLDFELYWGMLDKVSLAAYRQNLLGVRAAVPAMLDLFDRYHIHATWATVGFLFCETRAQLLSSLPARKPSYANPALSPYLHLDSLGDSEHDDPFHYAPSLIRAVASRPNQEIGTHTFSHYYCLEDGQDVDTFRADLRAALQLADTWGIRIDSLVFPRNQFNGEYLDVCRQLGIKAYRGNPCSWMYRAQREEDESLPRRAARLADAYVNLSSHNSHSLEALAGTAPVNVPASRFLRPYSNKLRALEPLRLRRIRSDLTYAARTGTLYHLWWHPHNFGRDLQANLTFLQHIFEHYAYLRKIWGMESLNMGEVARRLQRQE